MADDSGGTPTKGPGDRLSPDDLFELLSHHRRRYVIECLDRYGSPMSLPDLADECIVMEHQTALDDIPAETVKRMYMSLYHCHIPKLEKDNAVEYDQESDSVAVGPTATQLESHLTLARSSLSSATATALETLRGVTIAEGEDDTDGENAESEHENGNENEDETDGLPIEQAKQSLQRAGHDEESTMRILDRLERTGYIHFVNGHVRLIN